MIVEIVLAGFTGTALMSILMAVIHRSGWANADMIRALGSLVTRSYDNAVVPGLLIHFTFGILFAFPYTAFLSAILKEGLTPAPFIGGVMGLVHGLVVGLALLAVVTKRHPVERFQNADFEVAVAHIVGHVAYGFGVGLMILVFDLHWDVL